MFIPLVPSVEIMGFYCLVLLYLSVFVVVVLICILLKVILTHDKLQTILNW